MNFGYFGGSLSAVSCISKEDPQPTVVVPDEGRTGRERVARTDGLIPQLPRSRCTRPTTAGCVIDDDNIMVHCAFRHVDRGISSVTGRRHLLADILGTYVLSYVTAGRVVSSRAMGDKRGVPRQVLIMSWRRCGGEPKNGDRTVAHVAL